MAVEGKARGTQEEGFYTTSTMTHLFIRDNVKFNVRYSDYAIYGNTCNWVE